VTSRTRVGASPASSPRRRVAASPRCPSSRRRRVAASSQAASERADQKQIMDAMDTLDGSAADLVIAGAQVGWGCAGAAGARAVGEGRSAVERARR